MVGTSIKTPTTVASEELEASPKSIVEVIKVARIFSKMEMKRSIYRKQI